MSSTSLKNTPVAGGSQNGVLPEANGVMIHNGRNTNSSALGTKPARDDASFTKSAKSVISIIPEPVRLVEGPGHFLVNPETIIAADVQARPEALMLADRLSTSLGCPFPVSYIANVTAGRRIEFRLDASLDRLGDEGYLLSIEPEKLVLRAFARAGLFYGLQTILQLLPVAIFDGNGARRDSWTIPCVEVEDYPRFVWRGAMLDVSRHFMSVDFVKKFIDLLAIHKLNILHLHLNDDQGWRIEIKKYPKLTSVGAVREHTVIGPVYQNPIDEGFDRNAEKFNGTPHDGFYTQEEARDIVTYAAARHITVVPEIDMPGHAMAAIVAYPELGTTDQPLKVSPRWGIHGSIFNVRESTIDFLKDVLTEVMDIFPSPYIHIGGDECHKQEWRDSAEAQAKMAELGLETVEQLQSWFIGRMDEFVTGFNRRIVGWDEILEGGLAANAVVMSWRGEKGGIEAAKAGHDVIMSPSDFVYLDYYLAKDPSTEPQAFPRVCNTLETVYLHEPVPNDLPEEYQHHVLGTQGQLRTEYMPDEKQVEYMAYPRLCAIAEVTWTPSELRNYSDFVARLSRRCNRLDLLEVGYRPLTEFDCTTAV